MKTESNLRCLTVAWDVETCSLVEIDRHLRAYYCVHHQYAEVIFLKGGLVHTHRFEYLKYYLKGRELN
jgi:hypothetical protein